MKPSLLTRQLPLVALEISVEANKEVRRDLTILRKCLRSQALSQLFVLVAQGFRGPTELVQMTGKSKYAISLELAQLRQAGLLRPRPGVGDDLRRKQYEVAVERIADIFQRDHTLELDVYENHQLVDAGSPFHGTLVKTELAILGNGKLGLVKEVIPDVGSTWSDRSGEVGEHMHRLLEEFVGLFMVYLNERQFGTLREYLLSLYRELANGYRRFPRNSNLGRFYNFLDTTFSKIKPIEELWRRSARGRSQIPWSGRRRRSPQFERLKLFAEAGTADHTGRYLLNPEIRGIVQTGTRLRVYPSYTFGEAMTARLRR
jgi:hypothetical protein